MHGCRRTARRPTQWTGSTPCQCWLTMNKIDKLIKKLCPNGVEFKELWEITAWDKRFNGVEKNKQLKILSFNHLSSKDLKELKAKKGNIKLLATGKFDGWTTEELAGKNLNEGEVISIPSGGYEV